MIRKCIDRYSKIPVPAKCSFWFLICFFLQKSISVITTPIFTRLLSTVEYGQYSVFNSWLSIIEVFTTLCLFYGIFSQGLVKFEERRNSFASSMQGLCTILVIFWAIVYSLFRNFWNSLFELSTFQMIAMIIIIWTNSVSTFWIVYKRFEFSYRAPIILSMIVSVCRPLISILFVNCSDNKVDARIFGIMLVNIFAYSPLFFIQWKKGNKFIDLALWKYALKFNIPLLPHYLSNTILSGADRIMIQGMVGSSEAGIYSLAYSVSMLMTLFNSSIMQTLEPWILKKIKNKEVKDISQIVYPTMTLIMILNIIFISLAPEIVAIFAPGTYSQAIHIIPPVTLSVVFLFMYEVISSIAMYYEKTWFITAATIVTAISNIVLNYICINIWGYVAAAYTTLGCYIFRVIMHYIMMRKVCWKELNGNQPIYFRDLYPRVLLFLFVGFLFLLIYDYIVIRYILLLIMVLIMLANKNKIMIALKNIVGTERKQF